MTDFLTFGRKFQLPPNFSNVPFYFLTITVLPNFAGTVPFPSDHELAHLIPQTCLDCRVLTRDGACHQVARDLPGSSKSATVQHFSTLTLKKCGKVSLFGGTLM